MGIDKKKKSKYMILFPCPMGQGAGCSAAAVTPWTDPTPPARPASVGNACSA